MKTERVYISLALSLLVSASVKLDSPAQTPPAADSVVQSSTAPKPAPSFLKQASQKVYENAQKKILHNINERLNSQAPANGTAPAAIPGQPSQTVVPATGIPVNTVPVTAPSAAGKQAAPCRSWIDPNEQPVAALLCIHGLGLQSNSYEFFAKETSRKGIAVYAIDVRGFGSWMQSKGKTNVNFDECLADIKQAVGSIKAAYPGIPVYVLGESMGGAIALRAASMYPDVIDGLISSVPAGERFKQEKTSAKVFLNLLSGMSLADVGGDIVNQATQNAKLKSQWTGDPLSRLNLTPQELIQFQDFMNSNHEAAKLVTDMPVLFVQGNGDQLVKPEGTWELFNSVKSKDKSFFAVPGEHLIFEEAQTQEAGPRDQNFRVISSWLSSKVGRRNRRGWAGGNWQGNAGARGNTQMPSGSPIQSNTQVQSNSPVQAIDPTQSRLSIAELEYENAQRPNDPDVMSKLGRAYYEAGQADKAGYYFRRAMRLRRNDGAQANALNSYLLSIGQGNGQSGTTQNNSGSPFAGFGQFLTNLGGNATGYGSAFNAQQPVKVYAFYADWADQCKGLNNLLAQLTSTFSNKLDISRVNIEDPTAESLVEKYKIGPIPSVVFVAPSGKVCSTIIGSSSYNNYEAAARNALQSGN